MPDPAPETAPSRRRRWAFRGLAMLLGLSVFVLFEGLCHLVGWGAAEHTADPFVGFAGTSRLFLADEGAGEYRIAPSRRRYFVEDAFPMEKGPRTVRVFVLGGSTVQGRPYSIETSFPTFLEQALAEADPERDWEIVNCGGVSYASYRLLPILAECLDYEPDLFVVCTGHNEFLEDRTYGHLRDPSPAVRWATSLRTVRLLRSLLGREPTTTAERPVLPADADVILDYQNGLDLYHRDDALRAGVTAHFEFNVREMVSRARSAGVPVLLVRPPSNLRDSPPFKSELAAELTDEERTTFHRLLASARELYGADPEEACRYLEEALRVDEGHAGAWFEYGELLEALGRFDEARAAYVAARDHDVCPLRMITPLEMALDRVATATEVPVFDAHAWFEARSRAGILDGSRLVDHVHPSIEGHRELGNALVGRLAALGLLDPRPGWEARATETQRAHVESLDDLYFLHGQRTLETVRAWARGRATGQSAKERFRDR